MPRTRLLLTSIVAALALSRMRYVPAGGRPLPRRPRRRSRPRPPRRTSQPAYVKACAKLGRNDSSAEFSGLASVCRADIDALAASRRFAKCKAYRTCLSAVRQLHHHLSGERTSMLSHNRYYRPVEPVECRRAVSFPARDVAAFTKLVSAYRGLRTAFEKSSKPLYDTAVKKLKAVSFKGTRTAKAQLAQFRANCAPPS